MPEKVKAPHRRTVIGSTHRNVEGHRDHKGKATKSATGGSVEKAIKEENGPASKAMFAGNTMIFLGLGALGLYAYFYRG